MAYYRAEPIPCRQAVEDRLPSLWETAWRLDRQLLGRCRRRGYWSGLCDSPASGPQALVEGSRSGVRGFVAGKSLVR
jgi:hypothetical protein